MLVGGLVIDGKGPRRLELPPADPGLPKSDDDYAGSLFSFFASIPLEIEEVGYEMIFDFEDAIVACFEGGWTR